MPPLLIVNDDRFAEHLEKVPHLESPGRTKALSSVLEDPCFAGRLSLVTPRPATVEELCLVHSPRYVQSVADSQGKPLTSFDADTQATEKSYSAACLAVGSVLALLDEIRKDTARRGFAIIRPPGHHAEADRAMGFCLFNNVAIGARYLRERHGVRRVMVVDIDAHHGNGIQKAFYHTDEVLYVSLHQFPAYPGTGNLGEVGTGKGEGFTVNVPLAKGQNDLDICRILHFLLNPLALEYRPEIILVACGFDLYFQDRLGGMRVTPEGYGLITFFLLDLAQKVCDGRIAFIMEGGYSLKGIRDCGFRVLQELCDIPTLSGKTVDRITGIDGAQLPALKKVVEVQKKYWKILRGIS